MIIYTYIHIHIDLNHFRKGDITHRKEGHTGFRFVVVTVEQHITTEVIINMVYKPSRVYILMQGREYMFMKIIVKHDNI